MSEATDFANSLVIERRHPLHKLNDPTTIRVRCAAILAAVERGVSMHFTLDRSALPALADRVAALTLKRFPDLQIPLHSLEKGFIFSKVHTRFSPGYKVRTRPFFWIFDVFKIK